MWPLKLERVTSWKYLMFLVVTFYNDIIIDWSNSFARESKWRSRYVKDADNNCHRGKITHCTCMYIIWYRTFYNRQDPYEKVHSWWSSCALFFFWRSTMFDNMFNNISYLFPLAPYNVHSASLNQHRNISSLN